MLTLNEYLTSLASEAPAPGGGSAAMVVAAAGCSLVAMVARICAGNRKYEAKRDAALELVAQADALRHGMMELRLQDEAAYAAVVAARGDREALQRALHGAASIPLEGAGESLKALELAQRALQLGNANLASDVGCAAEFAYAALEACAYNVRINHRFMKDEAVVKLQADALSQLESRALERLQSLRSAIRPTLSR